MRTNFRDHRSPCIGQPWMGEMITRAACTTSIFNFIVVFFVVEGADDCPKRFR